MYLHQTGLGNRHHYQHHARRSMKPASARRFWPIWGLSTIRLLTNHPRKVVGLDAFGIEIVEQVPLVTRL